MAVSSKMYFLPQTEHRLLIKSTLQVIRLISQGMECLTACHNFYLSPVVCMHPNPLSFIISNTDIDILSSYLPASPPIAPVLNEGLVSAGTEMTVTCEISFNLFAINLILMFINSYLTVDQMEVPMQGVVDFWQHPSFWTDSCLLQISTFYF